MLGIFYSVLMLYLMKLHIKWDRAPSYSIIERLMFYFVNVMDLSIIQYCKSTYNFIEDRLIVIDVFYKYFDGTSVI